MNEHLELAFSDASFLRAMFLISLVAAVGCGLALWAATAKIHWFWRALAILAPIAVLRWLEFVEPMVVFAANAMLIVLFVRMLRYLRVRRLAPTDAIPATAFQYRMSDLLLGFTLCGVLMLIAKPTANGLAFTWAHAIVPLAIAVIATLVHLSVDPPFRWRYPIALAVAVPIAALAICESTRRFSASSLNWIDGWAGAALPSNTALISLFGYEMAVALGVLLVLSRSMTGTDVSLRRRYASRLALLGGTLVAGLLLSPLFLRLVRHRPPEPRIYGETDSDRALDRIGFAISSLSSRFPSIERGPTSENDAPRRQALLQESLAILQNHPCLQPKGAETLRRDHREHIARPFHGGVDSIARECQIECREARELERFDEAFAFAAAIERLGVLCQISETVHGAREGAMLEMMALAEFASMRRELPAQLSWRVIALLEWTDGKGADLASIDDYESYLDERKANWSVRLQNALRGGNSRWMRELRRQRRAIESIKALLKTDLAIRLFIERFRNPPRRLQDLAPDYLTDVPTDPYSGKPFSYLVSVGDFKLYSVGWDGRDDGGKAGIRGQYRSSQATGVTGLDLSLDVLEN